MKDLVRAWVATASTIPKGKEVAPSLVDTLLQIAYFGWLPPGNPDDVWLWLTLRPSLPPICQGSRLGSGSRVILRVQNLEDLEILKSYLLLVWSEWDSLLDSDFPTMCQCVRKEFSGVETNSHRVDLVQRLDHVIGQLDRGLEYFQRNRPELKEGNLRERTVKYEELRKILTVGLRVLEIPTCMSSRLINIFDPPTPADTHRISLNIAAPSPTHIFGVLLFRSLYCPLW